MVTQLSINRRDFIGSVATGAMAVSLPGKATAAQQEIPQHLKGYEELYAIDPRAASRAWFRETKFGLMMHYGVYSLLERQESVMARERISLKEYEKLKGRFTADKFDADMIADLAIEAQMRYVNITTRHVDSFALFRTRENDWNSVDSPAQRDLVGELAGACRKKGLGLFLYYAYASDWRHPYFFPREAGWRLARPDWDEPEPTYQWRQDEDFQHYINYCHNQLRELLTQYGPVAGIWLDPIMGYYARPDLFPIEETYALIRSLQPHCLISFKQGANGDEDFATPERGIVSMVERVEREFGPKNVAVARAAWEKNRIKQLEICDTLAPRSAGWYRKTADQHATPDDVMQKLSAAGEVRANLLLNTGPLGDGSIYQRDVRTLREVGNRLRGL